MLSQAATQSIVGVVGNIIAFGLFLSPTPTFIKIIKMKAVEEYSPIPYLATLMNCMLWTFYGLPIVHPNSLLVLSINAIGFTFECIYISIFLNYATRDGRMKIIKILAVEFIFMIAVVITVLLCAHTHEKRSLVLGVLCIIFGTCMYAAPLGVMKLVIQTRSVKYMPLTLSLVSFFNTVCWTIYGFLPLDINLVIPNGLGAILSMCQLILYAWFCRATPIEDETKAEVELPTTMSN